MIKNRYLNILHSWQIKLNKKLTLSIDSEKIGNIFDILTGSKKINSKIEKTSTVRKALNKRVSIIATRDLEIKYSSQLEESNVNYALFKKYQEEFSDR